MGLAAPARMYMRVAAAALLVASACRPEKQYPPAPAMPPQPSFVTLVNSTLARMHQRYSAARRIEEAIIWGDLATAQAEAGQLALLAEPSALPEWQPYFDRVRDAARELEASGVIASAARRSAELGAACADCHAAIGGRPVFDTILPPPTGDSVDAQMRAHGWGAARMWEGLIAPENARWEEGAGALVLSPITISEVEQTRLSDNMVSVRNAMGEHVEKIRAYASKAMTPLTQRERVDLYGEMLVTCASCHALVRDVDLARQ